MKFIIFILISISLFECRKKPSKNSGKRPSAIEPELYCNSCQAVLKEIFKKIRDSRKESDIAYAIDGICRQNNFAVYEFPPPDMVKGCQAFMGTWEETVEKALLNRGNNEEMEHELCNVQTKACLGVDMENISQYDNIVTVNNKKVPLNKGGLKIDSEDL
ncbi:hypothetical protein IMG5_135580 [Ichthyophthirius multifiliis]|uniref:Saposin B-type domain-containing protein n=1 Tax=Ichthyophthirius multifiliis TaxID=5932 RepID=G0QWV0_ICHMU|nr:hypothetical protein IMG5_135580 [Ichthyophthirius multifiliis]EGR30292.1 hypothetical protein IMG5_135580 [Ichthyophthirius multifiliis]|eukprot:XP_004031879.1 hypothetical protein IMG5_135580 [Ichthyophthirius multifiliis]